MNPLYYLLDTTDDGEDRSLLVVQDSLAEAVEYWRGYYELDANDTPTTWLYVGKVDQPKGHIDWMSQMEFA